MNERKILTSTVAMAIAGLALLSSCQQFFTTSLAAPLARDSYTIPSDISVEDAAELLASGDADVAAALVAPLFAAEMSEGMVYESLAKDLGTEGLGTLTQPQIDAALAALMAISLTPAESAALLLVSDDLAAPEGSAPDELYIAAFALAVDAFNDGGASEAELDTWLGGGALPGTVDVDSVNAAMALLDLAQAADLAGGSTSIFGQLLSGLSFE